jgi:amidohydrolase
MKATLPGMVMLIFQPAEESAPPDWKGPTGAELMRNEGDLSHPKPDVIYGMHLNAGMRGNAGELIVGKGALSYGLSQFRITIQGKGAHAARPWEGNDTVVTAAQTIMALQTIPSREVNIYKNDVTLSIGAIGGAVTFNVLPEAVTLDGALRYTDDSQRTHLEGRILEVAQGVAASAGESAKIDWIVRDPPILNDPALADAARASLLKAVDDPTKLVDYDVSKSVGVDDFSMFNAVAPTFFLLVGASRDQGDPAPVTGHHSPQFYVNEKALLPALRAELHMAVDYMTAHAKP